jgi:TPR repeat protein
LLDQQNTIDTPAGVTGRATNEQSLDEFVLAAYQPTSYAHALKSELPASINLEESRPITTTDQLVGMPGLDTPPRSIDSPASSLFEPASTLPDAALPFARATQPGVSSDDDLLRPQETPGSNHSQTPNLSAPPEASDPVPKRATSVAGPAASVAPSASTQTARPSAPSSSAAGDDLVARGRALLGQGDVGSARILLIRAFDAGAPSASFFLAQSYDPNVLASRHTYGASADLTKARQFYEHAHRLGMREAEQRLGSLNNGSARDRGEGRQHRFSGPMTQPAE